MTRAILPVAIVLGHEATTSQRFVAGVLDGESLAVDDLVTVSVPDPVQPVAMYGIVLESSALLEGATLPSDSALIASHTMPGELVRTAEIQVIRVEPERWIAPHPATAVARATGAERALALYEDTMERKLAIGLGSDGQPISIDLDFLDGTKGGHVSISGISGVATKTSTALALARLLLEHADMRRRARVLVFNVKGEDLLEIDKPNRRYRESPGRATRDAQWRALGLSDAAPFPSVAVWAPPDDSGGPNCGRQGDDVRAFGWTPWEFAIRGLLRFCFTDAGDLRSQLTFLEERIREQIRRKAVPIVGRPGAFGLADSPLPHPDPERRTAVLPSQAVVFDDLDALVASLVELLDQDTPDRAWTGGAATGTIQAFIRRLHHAARNLRHLIRTDSICIPRGTDAAGEPPVCVVHLTPLSDFAQRFVVGSLLADTFVAKEAGARDPIEFIVLDELNKYAPRDGDSPIKDTLIDIAQRGRSLGVILIGCQQQASLVASEVTQNAAIRIAGRLDAAEAERADYGWLGREARARARLLRQGRMLVSQPSVPTALAVELPFPPWATTRREVDTITAGREAARLFGS